MKYSTMDFTVGNSWSSKINGWEKPAQTIHLVIQFGCPDTVGDSCRDEYHVSPEEN
jgi:hypothetical protein